MNALPDAQTLKHLIDIIETTLPRPHHSKLLDTIGQAFPDLVFSHVLSLGGWHRAGGVLTSEGLYLDNDLEHWLNAELINFGNDFGKFVSHNTDAGFLVTRHTGHTHYFTAAYGSAPEEFLQLEVEELQEVLDRKLIDSEHPPGDLQEMVEPITSVKVEAHPIGSSYYRFVRLVDARQVLARQGSPGGGVSPLGRFMSEWAQSRAADCGRFCEHWVMAGLDGYDADANTPFTATPLSVHSRTLKPFHWDLTQAGAELGYQIQGFDRAAKYPAAWYFHFVGSELVPTTLAAVLKGDLDRGYEYLAEKDLGLLRKFVDDPYRVV